MPPLPDVLPSTPVKESALNTKLLTIALLLAGCGAAGYGGLKGTPPLAAGRTIIWHYSCESRNAVDVEYAQMGGSYSATLKLPDGGKRTLLRGGGAYRFSLDELQWASEDGGRYFNLTSAGQPLYTGCQAMGEAESDDLRGVRKIDPNLL